MESLKRAVREAGQVDIVGVQKSDMPRLGLKTRNETGAQQHQQRIGVCTFEGYRR